MLFGAAALVQFTARRPLVQETWTLVVDSRYVRFVQGDARAYTYNVLLLRWLHADPPADAFEITPDKIQEALANFPRSGSPPLGTRSGIGPLRMWWVSWWLVWALLVGLAALLLVRPLSGWRTARRRSERGQCTSCGYDLRGSSGDCPECGVRAASSPLEAQQRES